MKRFALAALAALLICSAAPQPAVAELPQLVLDRLAQIPVDRATAEQRNQGAAAALTAWRSAAGASATDAEQARLSDIAARAAFIANNGVEATLAAQATLANTAADELQRGNALLIVALVTFASDGATQSQLAGTLAATPPRADGILRSRAARELAIAHMRRDEQPQAQARWLEAQAAAGDIPTGATYDFEAALIGQAASYAYAGEGMEGSRIVGEAITRLGPEMARLTPRREISPGELVYANALAWKAAFRVQQSVRRADRSGFHQVGAATRDASGAVLCRGDFHLRPHPRFPYIEEGDWAGSTVLRLATDDQGQVIHADVVAAVPPIRAFSAITLQHAESWRYRTADDLTPEETPCRLNQEGWLMPWRFGG